MIRWKRNNPIKACAYWRRHVLKGHGLTLKDYAARLIACGGMCEICHMPERSNKHLAVDHDHTTGKIRGLLCSACNTGIGQFKHNALKLESAIKYLRR